MKHGFWWPVLCALILCSAQASAAGRSGVSATLSTTGEATFAIGACDVQFSDDLEVAGTVTLEELRVENDPVAQARRDILADPACVSLEGDLPYTAQYPISPTPNGPAVVWEGWSSPMFGALVKQLTENEATFVYSGGSDAGAPRALSVVQRQHGGAQLVFTPPPQPDVRSVVITITPAGGAARQVLEIPVDACTFQLAAPYDLLFGGAATQRLDVRGSVGCGLRLRAQGSVKLTADTMILRADVLDDLNSNAVSQVVALQLSNVPEGTLPSRWTVSSIEGFLGEFVTESDPVANALAVATNADGHPQLDIHYDSPYFEQRQVPVSTNGYAVVSTDEDNTTLYIKNLPRLQLDARVQRLADALAQRRHATGSCAPPDHDSSQESCPYAELLWRVKADTWREDIWLLSGMSNEYPDRDWERNLTYVDHLADVTFSVFTSNTQSLKLTFELRDPTAASSNQPVLQLTRSVALGARKESIPLPLADMLFVTCGVLGDNVIASDLAGASGLVAGIDVVTNGTTRAVNEDDLRTGQCAIRYSPSLLPPSLGKRNRDNVNALKHFGRQELEVRLQRGNSEQTFVWNLDPELDQSVPLPRPPNSAETGYYLVSVVLLGPTGPEVVYRPGRAANSPTGSATKRTLALGDLEFNANLRPRGRHGWLALPIRTFVTFPIEVAGFRFPANPRELQSSSDNPVAQIITGRAGVLFAIEPWDYDAGANPWPIPARLLSGFSLFKLAEGRFVPSLLTGVQFTVPILDLPKGAVQDQLGIDAALGFFWEHNLERGGGNHLVITVAADVLTLFGSK